MSSPPIQLTPPPDGGWWTDSTEFWEAVLQGIGDGIVAVDIEGHVLYLNDVAVRILDYGNQPAPGAATPDWSFVSGIFQPDRTTPYPILEFPLIRALRGESVDEAELFMRNAAFPEGRWVLGSARPLRDASGQIRGGVTIFRDVTRQKQAEEALRESEARFRELADNVDEVFWIMSTDFRQLQYVSSAFERITGRSRESAYARPETIAELVHPEDRLRVGRIRTDLSQQRGEVIYRLLRPDGEIRWVRARSFPIRRGPGDEVTGYAGISEDFTERYLAEQALARHARRQVEIAELGRLAVAPGELSELMRHAAQVVLENLESDLAALSEWIAEDNELLVRFVSRTGSASEPYQSFATRVDMQQSVGGLALEYGSSIVVTDVKFDSRFPPERLGAYGVRAVAVVPIRLKDRTYGTLGVHYAIPHQFAPDDVQFLEACAHILAGAIERHRGEERLRRSEARLRAVFDNLPDLICVLDRDGRVRFVNRPLPGLPTVEVLGQPLIDYIPERYHRTHLASLDHVFEQGDTEQFDQVAWNERWWTARYVPFRGVDAEELALLILTDITSRKQAELRLLRQQDLLRQSLEAHERDRQLVAYDIHDGMVQDVTGGLLHLDAIRLDSLSEKDRHQVELVRKLLRRTIDEGRRMISGLRPPIIDELGVVAALEYLIEETRRLTDCRLAFVAHVVFQRLDPLLEGTIYRIVQEALTNVARHSQASSATVSLTQRGDRLELRVVDNGQGFVLGQVRERRFGLQGIRERARMLHGSVSFDSAPGQGTTLRVELPLKAPSPLDQPLVSGDFDRELEFN